MKIELSECRWRGPVTIPGRCFCFSPLILAMGPGVKYEDCARCIYANHDPNRADANRERPEPVHPAKASVQPPYEVVVQVESEKKVHKRIELPKARTDCIYLREPYNTQENQGCGCAGKVRKCDVHDKCTTGKPKPGIACCVTCPDYEKNEV